jgi:hypothetical protein
MERLKEVLFNWKDDILAGLSYSAIASWFKYVLHHFIDIGWTVMAALAVMLATHYGKKYLSPWIDKLFKK